MSEAMTAPEPSAPAPAQATTAPALVADTTQAAPEWLGSLPEEMRSNPSLTKFGDVPALAKSYTEIQKLVGADKIAAPNESWGDEDWNAFYDRVGRPETADGYGFEKLPAPEGLPLDPNLVETMTAKAHELGLTQRQFDGLFGSFLEQQGEMMAGVMQKAASVPEQTEKALREEWGTAFDENITNVRRAYQYVAGDALEAFEGLMLADGTRIGDNPVVLKRLAKIGKELAQHGTFGGEVKQNVGFSKTPQEAKAEIASLQNDEKFNRAYMDRNNSEHGFAVQRMNDLYEQAYTDEGIGGSLIDIKVGETGPLDRA